MNNLKFYPGTKKNNILNVALVGHMGSGKSLIGRLVAKQLSLKHLDSDNLIEKQTKMTIFKIFQTEGEKKFRLLEEENILKLQNTSNIVLSLGGGSILSSKVRKLLKQRFITIFLDTNIDILVKRLTNNSERPLLLNTNIKKKIKELDTKRRNFYLKADIIIKNNNNQKDIVEKILIKYSQFYEKNY